MVIILVLFLTACRSTEQPSLQTDFKQGYGNLAISTVENSPPAQIYQDSEFKIIVKLENQGAYQATNGKLKVLGFDSLYINLDSHEQDIASFSQNNYLEGKSILNPAGEFTLLTFDAKSRSLFPGAERYSAPYFIQADYDYKTELTETICINPKFYEIYDSGCKVEPKKNFNGQGSPLAFTSLETIIIPGTIPGVELRMNIENKGRGQIKRVQLNKAALAGEALNCEFKNSPEKTAFTFKDKQEAVLICKKTLKDQKSYESVLLVDLSFSYTLKEKKTITILK